MRCFLRLSHPSFYDLWLPHAKVFPLSYYNYKEFISQITDKLEDNKSSFKDWVSLVCQVLCWASEIQTRKEKEHYEKAAKWGKAVPVITQHRGECHAKGSVLKDPWTAVMRERMKIRKGFCWAGVGDKRLYIWMINMSGVLRKSGGYYMNHKTSHFQLPYKQIIKSAFTVIKRTYQSISHSFQSLWGKY